MKTLEAELFPHCPKCGNVLTPDPMEVGAIQAQKKVKHHCEADLEWYSVLIPNAVIKFNAPGDGTDEPSLDAPPGGTGPGPVVPPEVKP